MMVLVESFFEFVRQYPALARAQRIGVAVSGGGDSVALACLARECFSSITLLHMNYGLRGAESDLDEALVRDLALRLGCEVLVEWVVPAGRSEEELRRLRYEWFSRCEVDVVLTGHTREDQAETVLFRLMRGTGPDGLAGISPVLNGRVFRPLLGVGRAEVRGWLESRGISWREDSSNLDLGYRRNWIRHELLPVLRRELNPEVDRALGTLAEIVWDESEWINGVVRGRLEEMVFSEGDGVVLDCSKFCGEALGLRRRLMRALLERVKGDLRELEFVHIEGALRLCDEKEGNGRIQVPGLDLMRSFGLLLVIRLETLRGMPERNFRVD
ncbi:MAG: tRNA lysidine(34) synthetase TilS, partial [Acidobacteria bacterium]|nr:tRNA lysidine(34) synthetase TilS [Acidobacteriota bacterium]